MAAPSRISMAWSAPAPAWARAPAPGPGRSSRLGPVIRNRALRSAAVRPGADPSQRPLQVRRQHAVDGQRRVHAVTRVLVVWQGLSMPTLSEDLAFRGLIHQVTDPDLLMRLDAGGLTVYAGFDPSADSLGVGNMLQLCTLRRFQLAGHRPISLAGGGTDSSGIREGNR